MRTRIGKHTLLAFILAVLIGLSVWLVCHQVRQEHLNRELIAAIKKKDTMAALALLRNGADANAQDRGNTPVEARQVLRDWWDRLWGRKRFASTYHPSALFVASRSMPGPIPPENVALIQALLDHGAAPNAVDENGDTALIKEVFYGRTETARLLLDHGADVNARGWRARTALMCACNDDNPEMMELLLERGAAVDAIDEGGETALMYATGKRNSPAVQRLLNRGADCGIKSRDGFTALSYATANVFDPEWRQIAQMLRDAG